MMTGDVALARLVDEVLPFWIDRGVDSTHGGLMTCLDRDGSVLDDDKGVWQQFRFAWLLARATTEVGRACRATMSHRWPQMRAPRQAPLKKQARFVASSGSSCAP